MKKVQWNWIDKKQKELIIKKLTNHPPSPENIIKYTQSIQLRTF